MKLAPGCYECLRRLIYQAAELATDNASLKQKAISQAMRILDSRFSYDQLSIVIATEIHKVIREVTGNPDPYGPMKKREMALTREVYASLKSQAKQSAGCGDDLRFTIQLAATANAIDFFKDPDAIRQDIMQPVTFVIDHSDKLAARLGNAFRILYLADNAGEVYFDLPLVKYMMQFAEVTYAVKPSPVQNDLTLADLRDSGLASEFSHVISTGVASPGIVFSLASEHFKREFGSADLVFAKGMGHYEALSEFPPQGRFFYCLKAKCQPVANSLGVPVNSYVAMLH